MDKNKILLALVVGVLILVGSSVGSAIIIETGIASSVVESLGLQDKTPVPSRGRPVSGFLSSNDNPNLFEYDQRRRQREDEQWQRQQELDGLRREFEQREEDERLQRDLFGSYP